MSRAISARHDFQFGVQVINEMQGDRFRSFWLDRRSKLFFSVMGRDQMKQMPADELALGLQILPGFVKRLLPELRPEPVNYFRSDGDMAYQLAQQIIGHLKAFFGKSVLPTLAGIINQYAGD